VKSEGQTVVCIRVGLIGRTLARRRERQQVCQPKTPESISRKGAYGSGYIQDICLHSDRCRQLPSHPALYAVSRCLCSQQGVHIKIQLHPSVIWPQCGYTIPHCRLKHPQVDKLTQSRNQSPFAPTTTLSIVICPGKACLSRRYVLPIAWRFLSPNYPIRCPPGPSSDIAHSAQRDICKRKAAPPPNRAITADVRQLRHAPV
jgi:hypothetical protein